MKSPLVLESLTKSYGKEKAVDSVSISLKKGEVFGFLGPNGAGKTTTIRTILNFIRPTSGKVRVLGEDSVESSVEIKEHIGYLAGDIALYEDMTGDELLRYISSLGRKTDWDYVRALTKKLQAELHRPIKTLSKGNKQKIGLIQAFMHHPELILLDEPTSGLDPLMQQVFYELVDEARKSGVTLFISSHNLQEVQRLCDRAAFIRKGKLVAIEDLRENKNINYHRYRITFDTPPKKKVLQSIKNTKHVEVLDKTAVIGITGSPDALIKAIAAHTIVDFSEEETTLEDVFMHYYSEDEHA